MKRLKQMLALLLAMIMIFSVLTACGEPQSATPDEAEIESSIIATAVQYAKSGKYTTTVTSDKVDLSGATAENIEIRCAVPYSALSEDVQAALATDDEAARAEALEAATVSMKADSVTKNGDGWDIAFTDPDAAEYATSYYEIVFTDVEDSAAVEVEFPEIGLEPDIAYVTPADDVIKLTLALSGSEFDGKVTADDLTLENAFSAMEIESVSAAGQNLTVQLKGELERNVAGAYQCGTVSVSPKVIKDGYAYVPAEVPVRLESAYFDASTMKYADGKITGDFKIYGVADPAELSKDNVKLDGATVEAVEQVDDNTVKLTLSAEDADSVNAFADLVTDSALTLGDYEGTVSLSQASFYPVYDYIEADGDNLKLTLKLYAFDGTFADGLSADRITFGDDFADAKAESLTLDSDTLATLILTIPANGMTEEDLDVYGTVTLADGAMVNAWGDKTTAELSSSREYSPETLGKGFWDTIKNGFKKIGNAIVDGAGTVGSYIGNGVKKLVEWGKTGADYLKKGVGYVTDYLGLGDLSDLLGGFLGGGSGNAKLDEIISGQTTLTNYSKSILAELGAVRGDVSEIKSDVKEIKNTLNTVLDNQYVIMQQLDQLAIDMKIGQNDTYRDELTSLQTNIELVTKTYELGAIYMALEDAVANGDLSEMPSFKGVKRSQIEEKIIEPYSQYLPDIESMTDEEAADYNDDLIDYINACSKDPSFVLFHSYQEDYNNLKTALYAVAGKLSRTDSTNPLSRYDEVCSYQYNFDSQAFEFRASTRLTAIVLLSEGMELVTACEKGINYPAGATFDTMNELVETAMARIIEMPIGHAPEEIKTGNYYPYSYVLKRNVSIRNSSWDTSFGYSKWYGALPESNIPRSARNWSDAELNEFFKRMSGRTLGEECSNAGLTLQYPLAKYYSTTLGRWYDEETLHYFDVNAKSATSVLTLENVYEHYYDYDVTELYQPFCVFELH